MFQQIAGSFVNAFIAKKATEKDRKNKQKQIDAQMEGFNLAKPYLKQMYSGTGQAVTDAINTGTFGNTYVDYFNPLNQQFIENDIDRALVDPYERRAGRERPVRCDFQAP